MVLWSASKLFRKTTVVSFEHRLHGMRGFRVELAWIDRNVSVYTISATE